MAGGLRADPDRGDATWDLIVIGAGIAGTAVALRAGLSNDRVLVLAGEKDTRRKSRSLWVRHLENIPGLFGTGTQSIIRDTLTHLDEKHPTVTVVHRKVESLERLDPSDHPAGAVWPAAFRATDDHGEVHEAAAVAITTGIMDRQPHIGHEGITPVLPFANAQQVNYCLRCDGHLVKGGVLGVFGTGEGAAWTGIILHERYGVPVHLLLHEGEPSWSAETQRLVELYGFQVHRSPVAELKGRPKPGEPLEGVVLEDGTEVPISLVFVSMGSIVYNELATQIGCEVDDDGFVVTDEKSESSVRNAFVVGDLTSQPMKQVYTAWEYGVRAADVLNNRKRGALRRARLEAA